MTYDESYEFMKTAFAEKTSLGGFPLPYRLFLPQDYSPDKKYPILLLLHGIDECGTDNEAQFRNGFPQLFRKLNSPVYGAIVIVPQCPSDSLWIDPDLADEICGPDTSDARNESRSLIAVNAILDEIMEKYSCDEDRVYVAGISLGAYGAWDMLLRHSSRFAAAMSVCGAGDYKNACRAADIPVRVYHGTADPCVKVEASRLMVNALRAAGNENVCYIEYDNCGHDIWNDAFGDPDALVWMFDQKRYGTI